MNTRRNFLKNATALSMTSLAIPAFVGRAFAGTSLKAYTYLPAINKPGAAGLDRLGKEVAQKSNSELTVQLNLGGSLPIKGSDITQAVGDGVIDIAGNGFFHGSVPVGGILRLPMLMNSYDEFHKAHELTLPVMQEAFAKQGVTVIGSYVYPPQVAFSRDKLESLDDLTGKKMRVTSAEQGAFVEKFGGIPVTIPSAEVTPALQRGVVDGAFTASIGGGIFWKDLLNYNYRLGVSFFDSVIIVNTEVFESLSAEEKKILSEAGAAAGASITQQMVEEEPATTKILADGGMKITEPTEADIKRASEAMSGYWDEWASEKGGAISSVLADVRKGLGV